GELEGGRTHAPATSVLLSIRGRWRDYLPRLVCEPAPGRAGLSGPASRPTEPPARAALHRSGGADTCANDSARTLPGSAIRDLWLQRGSARRVRTRAQSPARSGTDAGPSLRRSVPRARLPTGRRAAPRRARRDPARAVTQHAGRRPAERRVG